MTISHPTQTTILQPKETSKRIQVIDILRGFSILGILMVNLQVFLNPDSLLGISSSAENLLDQVAEFIIVFFAEGKFYTLLSLLFGIGFALQFNRAKEKGQNPIRFFPRRLLILFLFGILHSILLWDGDILTVYAMMGLILLFFRGSSTRKLFGVAISLLVVATILLAVLFPYIAAMQDPTSPIYAEYTDELSHTQEVLASGRYWDVVRLRATQIFDSVTGIWLLQGLSVLAFFLIGLYIGRAQILENIPQHRGLLTTTLIVGLIGGTIFNLGFIFTDHPLLISMSFTIGAPAFSLAYGSAICLLSLRPGWPERLAPMANIGRMSLTNYLMHSLICSFIFYGYGLGLAGEISIAAGLALTFVIYIMQVFLSTWWLRRFRFGPMEWLWRSLTYKKWQPIRKKAISG